MVSVDYMVLVFQIGAGIFVFFSISIFMANYWGAPWVTTPYKKIMKMLELADLQPGEKLMDLGSGDGRILIQAAKNYQVNAVGVEIDPVRVVLSKLFINWYNLGEKVKVVWGNMFKQDLFEVNVLTIFLTRPTNRKLKTYLEEQLQSGARVVSNAFPIPDWTPTIIDDTNLIFIYEIGKTGEEIKTIFV